MGQQIYLLNFPQISFAGGVTAINVPARIQNYSLTPDVRRRGAGKPRDFFRGADIPDLTLGMDVLQHLHMYVVPGQGKLYVTTAD